MMRTLTLRSSNSGSHFVTVETKSRMIKSTSSCGRFQFSVEKANTVKTPTPRPGAAATTS